MILILLTVIPFYYLINKKEVINKNEEKDNSIYQNLNVLQIIEKNNLDNNEFIPFYPKKSTNSIFTKIIIILMILFFIINPITLNGFYWY